MIQQEIHLIIRKATHDDVADIVRLLADDPLGSRREKYQLPLPESYDEAFREIERDPNQELVVVEVAGKVVGTLQLTFLRYLAFQGGRRAQIEAVRVAKEHRSQGIGRKLFEWAIARARQEGCHVVQLTADKSRSEAHRFYHRLGFVASHEGMKLHLERQDP